MRQRKAKDLESRMARLDRWMIHVSDEAEPIRTPGSSDRDLFVEIGCGKGDFLIAKALEHPENDYIGIEGQETVILRALEKAQQIEEAQRTEEAQKAGEAGSLLSDHLRFACCYVRSMADLFADGSLAGIYLNFSDPWPKSRHAKRRLTYRGRLREYAAALRPGGVIECKTDNDPLFEFTLEEIAACGFTPAEMSRDLHHSDLQARLTMTEYEKKFHSAGKTINYVKVIV